jgi:shikimate dehydrogenase
VIGTNTDVHGVRGSLNDLDLDVSGASVVVAGAGGAAAAAIWELINQGAKVTLANRTRERAEALAQRFNGLAVAEWSELAGLCADAELLVHTTSVGMDGSSSVIGEQVLSDAAKGRLRTVLDVVYAPKETALVHAARAAGLRAEDGLRMLVHQAAEAYRVLWDVAAPVDVMWTAAQRAAGR